MPTLEDFISLFIVLAGIVALAGLAAIVECMAESLWGWWRSL
jgi:hypothetical protein